MKIYCGGRANGKNMKAIQLSVEKQMPIICWNYEHKKDIEHRAYKMGVIYKMPEPILAIEVRKKVIGNRKGLIVDDLDILLIISGMLIGTIDKIFDKWLDENWREE